MASDSKPNPAEIALDIATNVEIAHKDPTNAGALEALHRDAQLLDGKMSWGPNGQLIDNNKPLQDAVKAELMKLNLPDIQIDEAGQIEADMKLPGVHWGGARGAHTATQNVRMLVADPDKATSTWDLK